MRLGKTDQHLGPMKSFRFFVATIFLPTLFGVCLIVTSLFTTSWRIGQSEDGGKRFYGLRKRCSEIGCFKYENGSHVASMCFICLFIPISQNVDLSSIRLNVGSVAMEILKIMEFKLAILKHLTKTFKYR